MTSPYATRDILNRGTGRRLTPEESAEKTKNWPRYTGKTLQQASREAQEAGYRSSNLPPGITQADIDNR